MAFFGRLQTEAVVSPSLPEHFPYLSSNKSEQLLEKEGRSFSTSLACMALTRSRSRALSKKLESSSSNSETDNVTSSQQQPGPGDMADEKQKTQTCDGSITGSVTVGEEPFESRENGAPIGLKVHCLVAHSFAGSSLVGLTERHLSRHRKVTFR